METQSTDTVTSKGRKPDYRLFVVNADGKENTWLQVGAAWANQDGKGFNIVLEALPLTGRLVMRVPTEKPEKAEAQ